jgi:hypothetical protein
MDLPDFEQVTRELVRWRLLEIANQGDRIGVPASIVRSVLRAEYPGLSRDEIHHAVRYVVGRGYLTLSTPPNSEWRISITPDGVDVVEYRAECPPSIARPERDQPSRI